MFERRPKGKMTFDLKPGLTILFLISSEGYFGVENMLVTLALSLSRLGCRCIVGVFCDGRFHHTEIGDRAKARGLPVEILTCAGRLDLRAVMKIRKLLKAHKVDVLHTHGYKADLYGRIAAVNRNVRLVATCHNWPHPAWSMRAYAALDRLSLKTFDRVVVLSENVAAVLKQSGLQDGKLATISNGIEIERFRDAQPLLRASSFHPDELLVGFVGRLVPGKGADILLRAAPHVMIRHPNARFVLVGDGPCREELQSLAAQLGVSDRVVFTGVREDMPEVYASLDLLVLPSFCEAMPMCVIEAMAAGKPVIATRVGAVPKLIEQDESGLLIEPGDVAGLAAGIVGLLEDRERAHRLGRNGQIRASERFSAVGMAKQYAELYSEILPTAEWNSNRSPVEHECNA